MKKIISLMLVLCCLQNSFAFAEQTVLPSEFLKLYKINKTQDKDGMDKILADAKENYSDFVPTTDNVSVRQGPGTNYSLHGRLIKNVSKGPNGHDGITYSNLHNIGADTFLPWIGGIVSNKIVPGDENCSGWQEVVLLKLSWLSWDDNNLYPDYSGLDDNNLPAYVCIDYIEKSPLTDQDVNKFKETHFPE